MKSKGLIFAVFLFYKSLNIIGQPVPGVDENIPYLMTFGKEAETSWGDDDYSQTFFFVLPAELTKPFYVRVFDADCGGAIDEINGIFDTQTQYSIYGGTGCYSNPDAQQVHPTGNYNSGIQLFTKTFGINPRYDNNWYTFGPINPTEGEKVPEFGERRVFKMITEGISGNDGNMYRYFLSMDPNENKAIEGANAFSFSYSFRMWDDPKQVSHVYPYVDELTTAVVQSNFDWDSDGDIVIVSKMRTGQSMPVSGENTTLNGQFKIEEKEHKSSLDIQLNKRKSPPIRNNNVVIYIQNQRGENMKFYASPIGGIPKPDPKVKGNKIPPPKK